MTFYIVFSTDVKYTNITSIIDTTDVKEHLKRAKNDTYYIDYKLEPM